MKSLLIIHSRLARWRFAAAAMIGYFEYTASAALIGHNEFTHVVITEYLYFAFFFCFVSYFSKFFRANFTVLPIVNIQFLL